MLGAAPPTVASVGVAGGPFASDVSTQSSTSCGWRDHSRLPRRRSSITTTRFSEYSQRAERASGEVALAAKLGMALEHAEGFGLA